MAYVFRQKMTSGGAVAASETSLKPRLQQIDDEARFASPLDAA